MEILSPEQNATRVISNILHCLRYGTNLGWLIDPEERLVLVFVPGQQPIELTKSDRLIVPDWLELDLNITQIFDWLKIGR